MGINADTLSMAEKLALLPPKERAKALADLTDEQAEAIFYDWKFWQRPSQREPTPDGWLTWLVLSGRGFGKTRMGTEFIKARVLGPTPLSGPPGGGARYIGLVAETAADARDVMVEGPAGLLAMHAKAFRPHYEPSKRRLTWPNGAQATLFNGVEPDQLRGPQHDLAWCDELAKFRYARDTWDNLQFGLRMGVQPQQIVTTTPRPIPILKELIADPGTRVTRGSTYENRANLAKSFLSTLKRKYEGTRLGRQELWGELIEEAEGSLWKRDFIEATRIKPDRVPPLARIVVSVDPAASSHEDSAETGILVCAKGENGHGYVLDDKTGIHTPDRWAHLAVAAFEEHEADLIVAEVNQGGDMVAHTIRTVWPDAPIKMVHAAKGKQARAEPVAALYEQGRVHHVGAFPLLEDQMCSWEPNTGAASPDRLDALVHGLTELMVTGREPPSVEPFNLDRLSPWR